MSQSWYPPSQICLPSAHMRPLHFHHYQAVYLSQTDSRHIWRDGLVHGGHLNETRQTHLFTETWKKRETSCLCLKSWTKCAEQGRMIVIVPEFELSVPFTAHPRQIHQSSFNVIYSHGMWRKQRRHKTVWAAEFTDLWQRVRERETPLFQLLNPDP